MLCVLVRYKGCFLERPLPVTPLLTLLGVNIFNGYTAQHAFGNIERKQKKNQIFVILV